MTHLASPTAPDVDVKMCENDDTNANSSSSSSSRPSRLLFASCNCQNLTQPLWPVMESRSAAALVWAGDAIYADYFAGLDWTLHPKHESATPQRLRKLYEQQLNHPGYRRFLDGGKDDRNMTVFGTMDDHDYGANNGDRTFQYRVESAVAFVDFVGEPGKSPIRKRAESGKGVYGVKLFDFARPRGHELVSDSEAGIDPDVIVSYGASSSPKAYSDKSVAVFVIDVRSNRTPWAKGLKAWVPSNEGCMLGSEQFSWLEQALRNSRASVNIIITGLQVHPNRFPNAHIAEEWVKFPRSRQRLYEAILQDGVRAPILVSGDVHMAQLMRKDCYRRKRTASSLTEPLIDQSRAMMGQSPKPRHLIELTTSGLTHSWGTFYGSSERFHNKAWYATYLHWMSISAMTFGHWCGHWPELLRSPSEEPMPKHSSDGTFLYENGGAENARKGLQYSLDLNFGEMEFDWESQTVSVRVLGVDGPDKPLLGAKWSFDQLSGQSTMSGSTIKPLDIAKVLAKQQPHDTWVCVNHRGIAHPVHYFVGTFGGSFILFSFGVMFPCLFILIIILSGRRFCMKVRA